MQTTRRDFLRWTTGALLTAPWLQACTRSQTATPENLILGGGRYRNLDSGEVEHVFSIVDLDRRKVSLIELDFLPHGIHAHPDRPELLAVFEKKGPNAALIDLESRQLLRKLDTERSRFFYGHGAYSRDGRLLFATETYLDGLRGVLTVRDTQTDASLGEFPSYGLEPHECQLIDEGRTLVVTNGGGSIDASAANRAGGSDAGRADSDLDRAPNVAYIDVASQKLLERVRLTDARINTGHSAVARDGALVVVSAPRSGLPPTESGGVSIRPRGQSLETVHEPDRVTQRMQGEALSVAIAEDRGIAAVTHPDGGLVTFWSTQDRRLLDSIDLPHPRGVTLTADGASFIVSYGAQASLMRIGIDALRPLPDSIVPDTYISGSHIYNWSRDMTEILPPRPMV